MISTCRQTTSETGVGSVRCRAHSDFRLKFGVIDPYSCSRSTVVGSHYFDVLLLYLRVKSWSLQGVSTMDPSSGKGEWTTPESVTKWTDSSRWSGDWTSLTVTENPNNTPILHKYNCL